jgi:hypothetical protein
MATTLRCRNLKVTFNGALEINNCSNQNFASSLQPIVSWLQIDSPGQVSEAV